MFLKKDAKQKNKHGQLNRELHRKKKQCGYRFCSFEGSRILSQRGRQVTMKHPSGSLVHFVSHRLVVGSMQKRTDFWEGTMEKDGKGSSTIGWALLKMPPNLHYHWRQRKPISSRSSSSGRHPSKSYNVRPPVITCLKVISWFINPIDHKLVCKPTPWTIIIS